MAESIDETRRAEMRKRAKERRKIMERERKKAVRAAYKRQRESKNKRVSFNKEETGIEDKALSAQSPDVATNKDEEATNAEPVTDDEKPPEFLASMGNRTIMKMYNKYIQEGDDRNQVNMFNFYQEIDIYSSLGDSKSNRKKKDEIAHAIHKTYFEQSSKKRIPLHERVVKRLEGEKDRPRTPTLKEAQAHVLPSLEESFTKFWNSQSEEYGVDLKTLTTMSKAELAMRSDDPTLFTSWKKKKGSGKMDGRAQPTKDDKAEFLMALNNAAAGRLPLQMLYFWRYIVKHSEENGVCMTERDLFFYCEVQKFKNCSHGHSDEEMLKKKVQAIMDCYIESPNPPSLQVDISAELQQRTIRSAQKYLGGKDNNPNLFDDPQYQVFKELLPYWAGFVRRHNTPSTADDPKKTPLTKHQRVRRDRLNEILAMETPAVKMVSIPTLPKGATVEAFTYSLSDGMQWKEKGSHDSDDIHSDIDKGSVLEGSTGQRSRAGFSITSRRSNPLSISEKSSTSSATAGGP